MTTTEANPGRVERVEQGEARPRNSAPRSGSQLELFGRRLKTWSNSEPWAALVQAQTYLYMYVQGSPSGSRVFSGDDKSWHAVGGVG